MVAAGALNDNSYPDFVDWRSQSGAFEPMATYGYGTVRKFTREGNGKPQIIDGVYVSSDFFRVLGILPQYGRSFTTEDENEGTCSFVISHEFWVTEFGGSVKRTGGPIRMSDRACTIIGVMPSGFTFPYQANPPKFRGNVALLARDPTGSVIKRGDRGVNVVARLRKDANLSLAIASAEMNAIQRRLAESFQEDRNYFAVMAMPFQKDVSNDVSGPLLLLFGSVTGVLLHHGAPVPSQLTTQWS